MLPSGLGQQTDLSFWWRSVPSSSGFKLKLQEQEWNAYLSSDRLIRSISRSVSIVFLNVRCWVQLQASNYNTGQRACPIFHIKCVGAGQWASGWGGRAAAAPKVGIVWGSSQERKGQACMRGGGHMGKGGGERVQQPSPKCGSGEDRKEMRERTGYAGST